MNKGIMLGAAVVMVFPMLLIISGSSSAQGQWCNVAQTPQQISNGNGDTTVAAGIQLDQEQTSNAKSIVEVVQEDKLPVRAAAIALMTSMQESSLRDLQPTPGHDAAGLFQQRPAVGWGTLSEVLDPVYSTNAFLNGVPAAHIGGLTSIQGWQQMDMATAAEMVQVSGVGYEYAKWENFGTALAAALTSSSGAPGVTCTNSVPPGYGGPAVSTVINRAMGELGEPYVWGGGGAAGPSTGFCSGDDGYLNGTCFAATHSGFDCSGLVQYAWWPYVQLPRVAADQYNAGTHIPVASAQPGDLLFYSNTSEGIYHVVMVVKAGDPLTVVEAPHTGEDVDVQQVNPASEPDLMPMAVHLTPPTTASSPSTPAS